MNNLPKHIVFLTPGFAIDEHDTHTIPALQLFFKELKKQFDGKISIITFQYPFKSKAYKWYGIDVYPLGGKNSKIKKYSTWKKAKHTFKQLNDAFKITHIHSFWLGECASVGSELATKYNLPHNCTLMGQDVLENTYFKKIKKLPNLITLSKFHSNKLQDNHQLSSIIIPWGVPENKLTSLKKEIDLIVVCSLISLKCVHEFIDMVSQLKIEHPKINCKIVGDGPLKKELTKKIKLLELTQNIQLIGGLSYNETQYLIAQSKILVHLSSFESFGMVVIEALAVNTKVIAKPVGIAQEINEVIKVETVDEAVIETNKLFQLTTYRINCDYLIENTVSQYLELFDE